MDNEVRRGIVVLVFGIIGVIVAYAEQIEYTNGHILKSYIINAANGVVLADLQIVTIVLVLLIGVIVAVVSNP